ncbi:double zinc ribbon domain-containing protein [Pseudoduganella sp. UC29_71]|uniref:ComF family protein n=1 Tax=Pseudoduganella sp. UC29_71 TaxID=3350174 RepID=UPI00366C7DAB
MPGAQSGPVPPARRAAALLARLGHALLPGACVLCGGEAGIGTQTCAECHAQVFGTARPRCRVCANPLPAQWHAGADSAHRDGGGMASAIGAHGGAVCGRCLAHPPAFDATVAAADYAMPQDQLVLQLKFGGRLALAALFGRTLADAASAAPGLVRPALLCPVPLGPQRLAERGFNQALEIARALGRRLDIAVAPRLAVRVHDTVAQSLVQPSERRANIAHAFAVPDRALVEGRHIGLVDDVMTSGQTLDELAATFKRHGAARITCLVFARTPPHNS